VYVVAAGGASLGYFTVSEYDSEGQTFAPSSTRDTATEVTLRSREEMTNVDIRFRPEGGHQVTGTVRGSSESGFMRQFTVMLRPVSTAMPPITGFQPPGTSGFAFSGVTDGSYDLIAQSSIAPGEMFVSDPYRIVVKGADVTGIELLTKPLASITGKVILEPSKDPECKGKRRPVLAETLIVPLLNSEKNKTDELRPIVGLGFPTVPDWDGVFSFRNLSANEYAFETRLLARYWYVQSISLPTSGRQATNRSIDLARNWLNVKSGERITGLSITLAEGAASFKGSVASPENSPLPQRLYLHLVPAEREKADDVLRFFATAINEDRSFSLSNLPPGRYWALLGTISKQDSQNVSRLRRPEFAETRSKLRRDAEAAKTEIELKPCQNIDGYLLTFKPAAPPSKQP
jgi:hypothetical protein